MPNNHSLATNKTEKSNTPDVVMDTECENRNSHLPKTLQNTILENQNSQKVIKATTNVYYEGFDSKNLKQEKKSNEHDSTQGFEKITATDNVYYKM